MEVSVRAASDCGSSLFAHGREGQRAEGVLCRAEPAFRAPKEFPGAQSSRSGARGDSPLFLACCVPAAWTRCGGAFSRGRREWAGAGGVRNPRAPDRRSALAGPLEKAAGHPAHGAVDSGSVPAPAACAFDRPARGGGVVSERLLILVPAFNEEAAVGAVIRDVQKSMPGVPILVVDDCSLDGTVPAAKAAGAEVLSLPHHLGLGGAVQAGYKLAFELEYEYVIRVDGDGQHDARDIPRIFEALRK